MLNAATEIAAAEREDFYAVIVWVAGVVLVIGGVIAIGFSCATC